MTDKMAFVCDEVTPEMIALDEMLATDDLTDVCPVGFDEEEWVEITREITIDPSKYRSPNYQPAPGSIPQSEPDPDDDTSDDLPPEPYGQDEAIALDATLPCNTTFANCQAKNPLLCPYHGAKLIEADIKAGLAQAIPNAVVKVSAHKGGQAQGKNFSISIKVPASQKLAAEKALDDFLQQPGIKSQGMKDWDPRSNEWSDFYDVDLLQLNSAPQGGMANRAALANSVGQSLNPQQPSQQQTPQTTPASQQTTATTPQQQSPNQMGTPAKSGHIFQTTYPTGPMTQPIQKNAGGWAPSQGALNALQTALGSAYNGKGLTWNKSFGKLNVACPNPTMQQGQAIADNLGNGYVVQVRGKSGFTIYPANQMPAQSQQKTSQPVQQQQTAPAQMSNGQQAIQGGYQPLSDVDDDRKFLTSMKGKAAANELQDLEDLIDEKEQLIDQIDATKLAMSNGDPKDAQMYQSILDYAYGGLKDVDEQVVKAREDMDRKNTPQSWMVPGQNGKQTIANMQALGCKFIPDMLSGIDSHVDAALKQKKPVVERMIGQKLTQQQYDKLCKDVHETMLDMFSKCEMKTYKSYSSLSKFMGHKSYSMEFDIYSWHPQDKQDYGITSTQEKQQHFCATMVVADDAYRCGQTTKRTMTGSYGNCAIVWNSDKVVGAYIDRNWCGRHSNSYDQPSLISNPQLCSFVESSSSWSNRTSQLIADVFKRGGPIKGASAATITKYLTPDGDHNECQMFLGGSRVKSEHGEDNLKCAKALEFTNTTDATRFIAAHKAILKQYGIIVYGDKKEIKF